ncbi:MAG: signal peptidase I [Eubacteriales bacterium]|nr:signal peptidase I [Eubacteriales bacterium]
MQFLTPGEKSNIKGRPYRLAIILAIIMFMLVAPEIQEGNSMDPTIRDGQVILANKFANFSAKRKAPDRDMLVVLDKDISLEAGAKDNIIARVIAVPGDFVQVKDGKVLVNGHEYTSRNDISGAKGKFKKKELKGNQIFVLSDNRSSDKFIKYDSRNPKLGVVDMRKIRGDVVMRIWPLNQISMMKDK